MFLNIMQINLGQNHGDRKEIVIEISEIVKLSISIIYIVHISHVFV